jgi:protein-L-isoaspartate(D-aspartate) O-methyltransferase
LTSESDLQAARQRYAEELRYVAHARSEAVVQAFARVPRERFLGPGPWRILDYPAEDYWLTPDADPAHVYHNVLIAIDPARRLNNGQPSLWAYLLDSIEPRAGERAWHIGAGTGYYSAILAELVGGQGRVIAIEADPALADRARDNLSPWPQVEVLAEDGIGYRGGPVEIIVVNAGVTHPQAHWLDLLTERGRLLLPLTTDLWGGGYLRIERYAEGYAARFVTRVAIFSATSGRDVEAQRRLEAAFRRTRYDGARKLVNSLRRDVHEADESCWLHAPDFCLSGRVVPDRAGLDALRFEDTIDRRKS